MNVDEKYMGMAIRLARRAEGMTNPNPLVGAVIVKNGKVIGKGYHKRCGLPHAEINALKNLKGKAGALATMYVTLEPCDHFGRTPPCTDAIIKCGIKKVVIGMADPNPINNGRGINKLNRYGVKATVGALREEVRQLNKPYLKFITSRIPYVTVKVAESIDGKIATKTGDSKWITGKDSRAYLHRIRGRVDAIMAGLNTVIKDDPTLLSKVSGKKQPIRIIADTFLRTPAAAKIFLNSDRFPVIIATTENKETPKQRLLERAGAKILFVNKKNGRIDLKDLLKKMGAMNIMHLLVEGGGELTASLVEERLVDRFLFFIAPKVIGGRNAITPVEGRGVARIRDALTLGEFKIRKFKSDILIESEVN